MNNKTDVETTEAEVAVDPRVRALAQHLGEDVDEILPGYGPGQFHACGGDYLVLTDAEADETAEKYIRESLWAFNASFVASFVDRHASDFIDTEHLERFITLAQEKLCDGANSMILAMIGTRLKWFAQEAVEADGRGHFLSSYDGEENEEKVDGVYYFIYRTN